MGKINYGQQFLRCLDIIYSSSGLGSVHGFVISIQWFWSIGASRRVPKMACSGTVLSWWGLALFVYFRGGVLIIYI